MQLIGKIIAGTSTTITTKQGAKLDKTRLKILDVGDETAGDVNVYWVDFMGDAALSSAELDKVNHQEATIEIRRITASLYNGKAYMNISGGMILLGGSPVQPKLEAAFLNRNK
jgi:ssDNA-binding replication factor A large subunit